jgi:cell division protein FtsB
MMRLQKILLTAAMVIIGVMFFLILFGDNGVDDLRRLRRQRDLLVEKNDALARENIRLYSQIERLKNDSDYIENIARQELGLIGKDELIIKTRPGADDADTPAQ